MEGISWEEFLKNIEQIHTISNELCDDWQIIKKNDDTGGTFLVKKLRQAISLLGNLPNDLDIDVDEEAFGNDSATVECTPSDLQTLNFEYHILYHISYGVPYLSFNAYKSNGQQISLEEAWTIFRYNERPSIISNIEITSILTQMEHPVLFKPFLTLHPCKTAEILGATNASKNKVLTFMSSMGPAVQLTMNIRYAGYFLDD